MVVLAIIGIIMSIVLTNQSSFNKTLILQNTAYDIALALRSAETYGIGSRASGTISNSGYGVHFQAGTPSSFLLFADTSPNATCSTPDCKPGDNIYVNNADTIIQNYTLGNGISVNDFCVFNGSWSCASSGGISSIDIVFARPNPDASIHINGSPSIYSSAYLSVYSLQGDTRFVSVASSGRIATSITSPQSQPSECSCAGKLCGESNGCGSFCPSTCLASPGCQANSPAHSTQASGSCCSGQCYQCDDGYLWDGNSCSPNKKANGETCSNDGQCSSGNCYFDADNDRYSPSTSGTKTCKASPILSGTDCNDGNAAVYPGTSGGSTCSYCNSNGSITVQTPSQDLFNECSPSGSGCTGASGNCSGTSYSCNTMATIDSQPSGCNGTNQYCDGAGNCKTMSLTKMSAASCYDPASYPNTWTCKPSTVNLYGVADQCTVGWINNHYTTGCSDNLKTASTPLYSDSWYGGNCPGYLFRYKCVYGLGQCDYYPPNQLAYTSCDTSTHRQEFCYDSSCTGSTYICDEYNDQSCACTPSCGNYECVECYKSCQTCIDENCNEYEDCNYDDPNCVSMCG